MSSYPGTGLPLEPGRSASALFEQNMCNISVDPIPSSMVKPYRFCQRRHVSAGSGSAAEIQSRIDERS